MAVLNTALSARKLGCVSPETQAAGNEILRTQRCGMIRSSTPATRSSTVIRDRLQQAQGQRARQIFEERMASLFDRLPMLSGFCVERDLSIAEVAIDTWPGWNASKELVEEIGRLLQDLVDETPDAAELLRGRTFARSFQ
jgi:hypothetical protein